MGRKIAFAVDGSDESTYAYQWGVKNVLTPEDSVLFIHGREDPVSFLVAWTKMFEDMEARSVEVANQIMGKYTEMADQEKFEYSVFIGKGSPRDVVVNAAQDNHVDILIVGSRGRGRIKRSLIGSVATYCMHHCHCPVLLVRSDSSNLSEEMESDTKASESSAAPASTSDTEGTSDTMGTSDTKGTSEGATTKSKWPGASITERAREAVSDVKERFSGSETMAE